ncbi:translation initiation factor [Limibacter armeniacum]|uniref:translation initiation factor n=1 Tax=Limibacter armeniacum TaxID=466084 RepID=UPI002FE68EC0
MAKKKQEENDWKDRLGVVFSTNEEFTYDYDEEDEQETLPPNQQQLRVQMEKKGRKGKTATLVAGFVGSEDDLKELGKLLKTKCGVGGTAKDGEIIIQGDFKQKIVTILKEAGYSNTK